MDTTPPRDDAAAGAADGAAAGAAAAGAADRLSIALTATAPSARLQAAMAAGTHPRPEYVAVLLERCAIEPDLNVRETLTWALMRHPASITVPLLIDEVQSAQAQARSQALHTLSKIGDPRGWAAITPKVLNDADDSVARTAWRVAVVLVPDGREHELARILVAHLGRGDRDAQMSLSRALITLGDSASPLLERIMDSGNERARVHAIATNLLRDSPADGFDAAQFDAELQVMLVDAAAAADEVDEDPGAEPEPPPPTNRSVD